MLLRSIVLAATLFATSAIAAPSAPVCEEGKDSADYISVPALTGYSINGFWAHWGCTYKNDINVPTRYYTVIVRTDFQTLVSMAGKITTARQGLSNLQSSWRRHVLLDWSDPSLAAVREDFIAQVKQQAEIARQFGL